jgi:hypothetical protein
VPRDDHSTNVRYSHSILWSRRSAFGHCQTSCCEPRRTALGRIEPLPSWLVDGRYLADPALTFNLVSIHLVGHETTRRCSSLRLATRRQT